MGQHEIDYIPFSVFIGFAGHGIRFQRRLQQSSPQKIGVSLSQAKCREEDPCLVPAARMMRVEAVIPEFRDLDSRSGTASQFHPRLNLPDCGRGPKPLFRTLRPGG